MLYDILTYTCASTERLSTEIKSFEALIRKTGTTKFEIIDLFNRTGIIIAQFPTQSEYLRGQAINAEIFRQLTETATIDAITAQNHRGRTLFSSKGS